MPEVFVQEPAPQMRGVVVHSLMSTQVSPVPFAAEPVPRQPGRQVQVQLIVPTGVQSALREQSSVPAVQAFSTTQVVPLKS